MSKLTAAAIREIASAHGLSHAEFVIEQAETQYGIAALAEARAEWNRLAGDDDDDDSETPIVWPVGNADGD